jgi:DNA-binding GntR family transcriptional regulator
VTAFDQDARRPIYAEIADDLRRRIAAGEWKPDEYLPSNKKLAAEYRRSTVTVATALDVLKDEGLIASRSTIGTYVVSAAAGRSPADRERITALERRVDELECQLADTRAAQGLDQWQPGERPEATG